MDLRSLLQNILGEVSPKITNIQIELHPLITWVLEFRLFQIYRIFKDMHHGITINREFEKLNYIYALWG